MERRRIDYFCSAYESRTSNNNDKSANKVVVQTVPKSGGGSNDNAPPDHIEMFLFPPKKEKDHVVQLPKFCCFSLTNDAGTIFHAVALTFSTKQHSKDDCCNRAFVLLGAHERPSFSFCIDVLEYLVTKLVINSKPIENDLATLLFDPRLSFPHDIVLRMENSQEFLLNHKIDVATCHVTFCCVSPAVIMTLVNAILLERSILLVSNSSILSCAISYTLQICSRPIRWHHVYVPNLPKNQDLECHFVQAPVPFLAGFSKDQYEASKDLIPEEVLVIDVDSSTILLNHTVARSSNIKLPAGQEVQVQLEALYDPSQVSALAHSISERCLGISSHLLRASQPNFKNNLWGQAKEISPSVSECTTRIVESFSDLIQAILAPVSKQQVVVNGKFNSVAFVQAHQSVNRPFMKELVKTMGFQEYLHDAKIGPKATSRATVDQLQLPKSSSSMPPESHCNNYSMTICPVDLLEDSRNELDKNDLSLVSEEMLNEYHNEIMINLFGNNNIDDEGDDNNNAAAKITNVVRREEDVVNSRKSSIWWNKLYHTIRKKSTSSSSSSNSPFYRSNSAKTTTAAASSTSVGTSITSPLSRLHRTLSYPVSPSNNNNASSSNQEDRIKSPESKAAADGDESPKPCEECKDAIETLSRHLAVANTLAPYSEKAKSLIVVYDSFVAVYGACGHWDDIDLLYRDIVSDNILSVLDRWKVFCVIMTAFIHQCPSLSETMSFFARHSAAFDFDTMFPATVLATHSEPLVERISVCFGKGNLGLGLEPRRRRSIPAVTDDSSSGSTDAIGCQIQTVQLRDRSPLLQIGDVVEFINEEEVLTWSFEAIIRRIRTSSRPMNLSFRRSRVQPFNNSSSSSRNSRTRRQDSNNSVYDPHGYLSEWSHNVTLTIVAICSGCGHSSTQAEIEESLDCIECGTKQSPRLCIQKDSDVTCHVTYCSLSDLATTLSSSSDSGVSINDVSTEIYWNTIVQLLVLEGQGLSSVLQHSIANRISEAS